MEITGIITKKDGPNEVTATFKKLDVYIDCSITNQFQEKFENHLCFQFTNKRIEKFLESGAEVGDGVKISFQPQGRYFEKKDNGGTGHRQSLNAFAISVLKKADKPVQDYV